MTMSKKWTDENHQYTIDFSSAENVYEVHDLTLMYGEYLSDADIVVEEKDKLLFIEYKNSNVGNVSNPEAFHKKLEEASKKDGVQKSDFRQKLAKKFYGTLFVVWACNYNENNKPIEYIFLCETNPLMDARMKLSLREKMIKQLPFKLKDNPKIKRTIIDGFEILNFAEWKKKYPDYEINQI